jgi:transposase
VLTDANGTPMTVKLTAANAHDVTQLLPLVDGVPAVGCRPGRPRRRFDRTQGDRAYDSEPHRRFPNTPVAPMSEIHRLPSRSTASPFG